MSLAFLYGAMVAAFALVLMMADAVIAYKKDKGALSGISGFRRSIIALSVVLVLGISVFHLLVHGGPEARPVVNNVLSMLAGLVSAIAGFYFGGRFAEKREEERQKLREAEERARKAEEELQRLGRA